MKTGSNASRLSVALVCAAILGAGAACGGSNGTAATSSRLASSSPTASASPAGPSTLDSEVPMPNGFPPDVPIYPGARLTAAASFTPAGQPTTWGMEWETLDSVDKVHAFYSSKLSQGDWTIEFSGSTGAKFAATFRRKSNPKSTGGIGADGSSGVTKISMSLVN